MQISNSIAAIIAAVCAGVGALLGTLVTTLYNRRIEKRKRRTEERDAVSKYRDVLLRSSEHLQSHLRHLCSGDVPTKVHHPSLTGSTAIDSYAYCILIYRIGQLFCYSFLLQNDIQTIYYTPTPDDRRIMDILYAIQRTLEDSLQLDKREMPFQIFRGFQESIGELMTVGDGEKGTRRCIGYPAFWKAWTAPEKNEFRPWFSQIEEGLRLLSTQRLKGKAESQWGFRVMQVQHLLIELANALDPTNSRIYAHSRLRFEPTTTPVLPCICTHCKGMKSHSLHSLMPVQSRYDTSEILTSLAGKYHVTATATSTATVGALVLSSHPYQKQSRTKVQSAPTVGYMPPTIIPNYGK
jgi:hypothetical protein